MARHAKNGLDYFPLDTDFDCDDRIRYIRRHGGDVAVFQYLMILKEIYRVGYCYRADEVGIEGLSELLRITPEEFGVIIELLKRANLLSRAVHETTGFLTSKGIQLRYFRVLSERKVSTANIPDGTLVIPEEKLPRLIQEKIRKEKEIEKERERKGFPITPDNSGVIRSNSEELETAAPALNEELSHGSKFIRFTENQYQALLVNYYNGDDVALQAHIEEADAHCHASGKYLEGERAVGFLRRWKIKAVEFTSKAKQGNGFRKSKEDEVRDSDDAIWEKWKREAGQ